VNGLYPLCLAANIEVVTLREELVVCDALHAAVVQLVPWHSGLISVETNA
jgi:hypothetical protein